MFISHASQDARTAQKICDSLEQRSVSCWIAPRDVSPGTRYGEEIIRAIEKAEVLVVLLSKHANMSNAVANEVERAFSNKKLIIPLRLQDVKPSSALEFFVGQAQWIDMWDGPAEEKIDQLVTGVRAGAGDGAAAAPASRPVAAEAPRHGRIAPIVWAAAGICLLVGAASFYRWARASRFRTRPGEFRTVHVAQAPAPGQGVVIPRYHALVIGVNKYAPHAGEGWGALNTARPDAEEVADLLERDYGFSVTRLFDKEATRGAMMAALDALVSRTSADACVVYFAGHGFFDKALGEGYWIPSDAKKTAQGRSAREDWLWNSTITKIIGASLARHVLVIADSCYGGSLFRGEEDPVRQADMLWYGRALAKPSRYLIASGDIEPVPDSGGRHSVFAQQLLNYLSHTDKDVFSASDLGIALREKVSAITGQMVRMGPLTSARHAGGEFVFVRKGSSPLLAAACQDAQDPGEGVQVAMARGDGAGPAPSERRNQLLRDALALGSRGATNAAASLVASIGGADVEDRMARAVTAYLDQESRSRVQGDLAKMIGALEKRRAAARGSDRETAEITKPRIIACLGPGVRQGGADAENLAMLYRICLRSELAILGRVQVVEREALAEILAEMNLGTSDLADARARTAIGKLLPAGMLLLGDLLPAKSGDRLYMRLVDTETSRILASFSDSKAPDGDIGKVCAGLAAQIVKKVIKMKPLAARVTSPDGQRVQAAVGRFHGAYETMQFALVQRVTADPKLPSGYSETIVGKARVKALGDMTCDLVVDWSEDPGKKLPRGLWVKEAVGETETK